LTLSRVKGWAQEAEGKTEVELCVPTWESPL
jgi:hypothetical protein